MSGMALCAADILVRLRLHGTAPDARAPCLVIFETWGTDHAAQLQKKNIL